MVFFLSIRSAWGKANQSAYRSGIEKAKQITESYWEKHPALRFSFLFLTGTVFQWQIILPLALLWFFSKYPNQWILSLLIPFLGYMNFQVHKSTAIEVNHAIQGVGYFQVLSVRSPRNGLYLYKGKFIRFKGLDGQKFRNIYCTIAHRGKNRPDANFDYIVEGKLSNKSGRFHTFKMSKQSNWKKSKKTSFLNEWRYLQKSRLRKYFNKHTSHTLTRALITSLATGEVDNNFLRFGFARLGLSHVLAISGFHFALVVAFLTFFLKKIFPDRFTLFMLIVFATGYQLFIGNTPSVFRAWTLVSLYIVAALIGKKAKPMNLIGIALLINLILSPDDAFRLGFQLSYLSYSAIILLFPFADKSMQKIIKNRPLNTLTPINKLAFQLLMYFRSAIGLNIAVHLLIFPILLFYFSKFPLYSLLYNLFIPTLISLFLYLSMIATFTPFLFPLVECFSKYLLRIILYPPTIFEYTLRLKNISLNFVWVYVIIIFFMAVQKQNSKYV